MTTSNTVNISEIPLDPVDATKSAWGASLASQYYFAIANGTDAGETFDAADLSSGVRTLMATYGRGVSVNMGGGDDTVTGSAYGDTINAGAGTNYVDGGANLGKDPNGQQAHDVLNVFAASQAAANALTVTAIDAAASGADGDAYAAGYRIKVSNGTETDYLKNVEQVNVFVSDGNNGYTFARTVNLAVSIYEADGSQDVSGHMDLAWVHGTDYADSFNVNGDLSPEVRNLMDQNQRGVWVETGAGNDTISGSAYGDDINAGSGTNYVAGGGNAGSPPWGGKAVDTLHVTVADQAAADAVQVVSLTGSQLQADIDALGNGFTHKVVAGGETDYIQGIERVSVEIDNGNGATTWAREIPLSVVVQEANLSDPNIANNYHLAWIDGTADADTIDASGASALLSNPIKAAMAASGRGVWIDGGAGNDTITGSAYADNFRNGDGNAKIDGGANAGPNGANGMDVFEISVASAAAMDAVTVSASDDPGYQWMVTYGAGSTQKDYLKNVEAIVINVDGTSNGKWIPLAVNVNEIHADADLPHSLDYAWAQGTAGDDTFDAAADVSSATRALMDQHQRGVWVDLGAGNDTITGSGYGDDIQAGSGTNHVDGGANAGSPPWGGKALDTLHVTVADQAAAEAVQVVALTAGSAGEDATAFANGYTFKVVAGAETDYIKNIERVSVQVDTGNGGSAWARDIPLTVVAQEANLSDPNIANYYQLAWITGTANGDTIDASAGSTLLSSEVQAAMAGRERGVWIDGGAGDDTITGSAFADSFRNGAGNSKIDGGANDSADGHGMDVFEVTVADAAALAALQVSPSDDPAYTWMVTYGAGSTQKDYLKNIEGISVNVAGASTGKWIPLAISVYENADPAHGQVAWVQGTDMGDSFNPATDLSAAQRATLDQYQHGVDVSMGAGDDTAAGTAYGDSFQMGSGTNYVDGGANQGTAPWGGRATDVLHVQVGSQAALDAVAVTALAAGMSGADAAAFANGYTHKVVAGDEVDYVKGIERVSVYYPNGTNSVVRDIALAVVVNEANPADPNIGSYGDLAWVTGTAGNDTIDASAASPLLSDAIKAEMDTRKLGVYIDGGAGSDVITGTGYADVFVNGAGNAKIDGGANAGPNGQKGMDVFQVAVASSAELSVVKVAPSDDPAYQWMVTYGTGSTQKDYLKNVEAVSVYVTGASSGKWIPLALNVNEVSAASPDLAKIMFYANAQGTAQDETFNAATDVSAATQSLMAQHGRGVYVDMGAGNDTMTGTAFGDNFVPGAGTNYVDGGDNLGAPPSGGSAMDTVEVFAPTQAAASAVTAVALTASMTGADGAAYAAGYRFKLANGSGETDYLKNVETVSVSVWNDLNGDGVRDYHASTDPANEVTFARSISLAANTAPTFGGAPGGMVVNDAGLDNTPVGGIVLASGKMLALVFQLDSANAEPNLVLTRSNADGSLDTSFGASGRVTVPTSFNTGVQPIELANGKLLVAVSTFGSNADFKVLRLNADGSLDTAFGTGGASVVPVSAGSDPLYKMALDPNGKIVLVGGDGAGHGMAVVRLNADGTLDTGFNGSGKLTLSMATGTNVAEDVSFTADGKMVVAGFAGDTGTPAQFALARINADGTLDNAFNSTGKLVQTVGAGTSHATAVHVLDNGKVLVAGYFKGAATGPSSPLLMRLNADGSLDATFGSGGLVKGSGTGITVAMLVQPDGKIVTAGTLGMGLALGAGNVIARYNADGSLDTSFGNGGIVAGSVHGLGDGPVSLALVGGKIVVFGATYNDTDYDASNVIARLNADGTLDSSFGAGNPSTLGGTVRADGFHAVALDLNVSVFDAELAARGNYGGATVTLMRHGGASGDDQFSGLGDVSIAGGTLSVGGASIGTAAIVNGMLTLAFNSAATQGMVNRALHGIGYTNANSAPPSQVTIDWTFSDGNDGSQGSGGAKTAAGSTTVQIGMLVNEVVRSQADPTLTSLHVPLSNMQYMARVQGTLGADSFDGSTGFSAQAKGLMDSFQRGASFEMGPGADTVKGTAWADSFSMGSGSNRVDGGGNGSATRSDSLEVYASSQADADAVQVTSLEPGALGADAAAFAAGYTIKVVNGSETDYLKNIQQVNVWRWTDANGDHVRDAGEVAFVRGVQTVLRVNETQVSSTDPAIDTNGNLLANAYSLAFAFGTPLNDVFVAGTSISATGRALMDQYKRGAYVDMGGGNDAVVGSAYGDIINGGKGVNRVDGGANDGTDPNGYVARDSLQVNLTNQAGGAGAVSAVRLTSAMTGADGQAFADGYAWKVTAPGETDYVKNIEQVNVFTWDDANGNGVFDNGEATGGKTIQLAPQINEVAVSSTDPAKDANGQPLVNSYHFAWAYGTDGDDVISAATAVSARTLGLMDQYKRGMYFDTGAGNDVLAGTGYGDEFHAGAGTNKIDGGANAGTDANGFAMRDVLQVQVSPQSPAVNVIKLTASMGGADATAFGEGYTWKVSAAGETDYIKNIETVRVLTWNDANGNGQMDNGETAVREILLAPHTDEVRVSATDPAKDVDGNALSTYQNFAWAYGGIGDDVIGPADATAQAQALMTQYQRGMFFDTGAGNDTLAGTAWGDDFVAGPGINRVDGGANGGTDFAGQPAHDVLEVYVADQAAADAVTVTALTAAMAGDDGAAYAAGYRFKVANGSVEVDYLKDIEQVNVAIWNDKNGDGQRYYSQDSATNEVTFVRTITPGAEPPPPPPPPSGNSAPTFGPQAGVSVVDGGFDFAPIGFTTLGNGKYLSLALMNQVADGNNYASVLVRHNADGSLDTSFGSGGRAFPGVTFGNVTAPVVQADGKILWAVSSDLGPNADFKIVRLNGDGSVDTSFGTNGAALVSLSAGVDTPSKLLIQGDGKIVVAGTSATNSPGSDFAAVRLNADGSLDTGYNGGGKVTVSLSGGIDKANAAALQADGKLVIAGRATGAANNDYAVVRINTDGSVDTTFAGTGKLVLPVGAGTDVITSIAVLGDGGILLGGNSAATGGNDLALVKLKADGTLDTGFGTGGKLVVQQDGINDQLNQVKVQADGKIVVAASHGLSVEVLRLNADGTADTGFGHDGKVMMSLRGIFDRAVDLAFAGDKIVLLAGAGYTIDDAEGLVLARLNADGSLDTSFAPSQVGSLGGTVHADGIHPAVLDMNAAIYDAELAARNDYNGATLTLVRHGGASAEDLFVATGEVSFAGGVLSVAGAAIGHIDNSGGTLTLHFDAGSSQGLVNRALHGIGYANSNATPPSGVTIDWSFSDGNDGTQGSGGAMAASGSTSVQIGVVTHEVVRAYANPATAADGRMLASIESFASVSGTLAADNVDATGFSPAAQALMAQYQRGASFNTAGGGDHVTGTAYADSFSLGKGVNYVDGGANVKAPDMLFLSAATQAAADAVQVVQLTSGMAGLDATAFAQGYTWKVVAGDETDYVKNVEMVGIGVFDGTGQMTYHRDVALAVTVTESGPTGGDIHHVANVQGTDRADTIDMSGDTPLLSADAKAAMDSNGLGVYIDGGAGDDTIIGTAHPDMFANGPGNSHIDGGANSGPEGQDVFQVAVGTAEQVAAVAVVPSDDPAYTWMVTYGAGSTQKDYLKNVEGVNVFVPNSGTGRWIPLALTVQENNSADLSKQYHMAFVNGTSLGEHFDAGTDLSAHTHTVMDQYQRGVWIDMGGGDDTVTGSQYYDDIRPGAGTNYVDGGANAGSTPDGHQQGDTLHVSVASQADADAAQVTKLAAGMSGADAGAFAQGYTFKVTAAGETDYIRNIEGISVEVTDANGQVSSSRHIALALSVNQGDLSAGGVGAAAFINGTLDADVIDASAASPLLPDAVKAAMDSQGRGVYIDGGAGNDTITGSAHPDTFINGSGNSHIDGGANVGAEGQDVFQVAVTSAAQVDAVTVLPSDDPNYTWMVTYGAGSTEKDYLKNVEGVSVYVPNGTTGRWIPLALSVHENGSADLGTQYHMAFVDGTVTDERFDAGTDLSAHAHSVMDQYQRGLYVEMGGGDDTVVGSAYYDDINAGAGINYVDGGGNAGAAPDGHHPGNSLHVSVDSQATADAVQVTQLAAGMSGADADAFAQGYKYKVVAPGETDYVKNIDHVWVEYATGTREIGLSVSVFEFDRTAPDAANYFDLANINGTIGNDVIDASAGSSLLSSALQDAMASSKRGVYINGGAGDDTITGSAYADTFENGAGNSRIDGGANATNMPGAIDTFSIKVATAAELAAVQVAVSDDPNYQFMVTYGAGSTQKDYLKNIEGVNAYVDGSSDGGRFIQLAVSVNEVSAADAATSTSMAWANGSAFNDTFDAGVNVTAATQSLMTQYSRGVWVNMGAGDDTVIGSAFGDDITAGAGVNHIDGGANGGTDSGGQPAQDILRVMVASEAAAAAVTAVALDNTATGADLLAFNAGYTYKITAGDEIDYVKNVEQYTVSVWNDANHDGRVDYGTEVTYVASHNIGGSPAGVILVGVPVA